MKKKLSILLCMFLISVSIQSFACTIFYSNDGANVFAGNNEDFLNDINPEIWFEPSTNNEYGCAFWGFKYSIFKAKWIPQGGMNEKGLFMDKTSVVEQELIAEEGKKNSGRFFINSILKQCATVEEAVQLCVQYNLKHFTKGQIFLVDKSGDFAIIENNTITRRKDESFQVVSNFRASDPSKGGFPCKRYSTAMSLLNNDKSADRNNFENILNAVHQTEKDYSTIYSTIADLKNGKLYVYNFHNFEAYHEFDLNKELQKGNHKYFINDLFPERISNRLLENTEKEGEEKAIAFLNDNLENSSYTVSESELHFFAKNLEWNKSYQEALKVYQLTLKRYPESTLSYLAMGKIYLNKLDIENALANFKQVITIDAENAEVTKIINQFENPAKTGNVSFKLDGFDSAKLVMVVFNTDRWEKFKHIMYKENNVWNYQTNLAKGTYEYYFLVDGKFVLDPNNNNFKDYGSVKVNTLNVN